MTAAGGESRASGPGVSVLMPTHRNAAFIRRALDDAGPDDTAAVVAPCRADPRIRHARLPANAGLGAAPRSPARPATGLAGLTRRCNSGPPPVVRQ